MVAMLINKLGKNNIKYTISISDWAALLSVADIFIKDDLYNKNMFTFNQRMLTNQMIIFNELVNYSKLFDEVLDILKK